MNCEKALKVFKALGEDTRLRILRALETQERCACELPGIIGRTQSNTSMHLAKLLDQGLVKNRREGKKAIYTLADDDVKQALRLIR